MSRTTFASNFKAAAGQALLAYLTEWRMRLAERAAGGDDARRVDWSSPRLFV